MVVRLYEKRDTSDYFKQEECKVMSNHAAERKSVLVKGALVALMILVAVMFAGCGSDGTDSKADDKADKKTEENGKYDSVEKLSEEGISIVEKDGKYGIINGEEEEILPCQYQSIGSFDDGIARVEKDDKYGFVNTAGEEVAPCQYEEIGSYNGDLAKVVKDGKVGYINKEKEEVIPCKYEHGNDFYQGKANVVLDGEDFYIDKEGNKVQ